MAQKQRMDDLFLHILQDIYYAERHILKALPRMAKATASDQLRHALQQHREETQTQIERLQKVFESLGKRARGVTCEALNGLVEEADEIVEEFDEGPVRDAGLLASAQAVEHYEISRYGTLIAWAKSLGLDDAASLLEETLEEEKRTDQALNQIAIETLNKEAKAA
jgi:ferritin-like metal-binding protein YciE